MAEASDTPPTSTDLNLKKVEIEGKLFVEEAIVQVAWPLGSKPHKSDLESEGRSERIR